MIEENEADVYGWIQFTQSLQNETTIEAHINNLSPGNHGIHVHQYHVLNGNCSSTGPHFNPYRRDHGDHSDKYKHVGDLGNWVADENRTIDSTLTTNLKLYGESGILGKSIVIHADQDDLGRGGDEASKQNGNAGARVACCSIHYA